MDLVDGANMVTRYITRMVKLKMRIENELLGMYDCWFANYDANDA